MKTWQDLLAVGEDEKDRMQFCMTAINDHRANTQTRTAEVAQQYYEGMNVTITTVDKFITDAYGKKVPDIWSPNHKIKTHLYPYFVNQQVLTLLGNGISFTNPDTLKKLGPNFEKITKDTATNAVNGGAAFGFWNLDHLERFPITQFAPLYDEETGRLMAGIRFWQLSDDKPFMFTLFEPDGYTEYIKRKSEEPTVRTEKQAYVKIVSTSATGTEIAPGEPYPGLPIIPMYNVNGKSALYGNREALDAYDLIVSKLVNNIDNAEFIYWIIRNAPYMADDPEELQAFIQRLKTSGVVAVGDQQEVEVHQVEVPFEASDAALAFLRKQIFSDFMAFDPTSVTSGADTATQILASYEPLNEKLDLFEYQVTEFVEGVLAIAGIDDVPSYTRSVVVNQAELIQNVVAAAEYTGRRYATTKLLEILGDADKLQDVIDDMESTESERFENGEVNEE